MAHGPTAHPHASFPSTRWSAIRPDGTDGGARRALEELARSYGGPIQAYFSAFFARAAQGGPEVGRDAVQDFFVWVLESGFLSKAEPGRGSFRAFLKTALRHHAVDALRRAQAAKRGGDRGHVSLEAESEGLDPIDERLRGPEAAFDDAWRASVVERALALVRERFASEGKERAWRLFEAYFLAADEAPDYAVLAARHAISTADVSNALQLAKRRLLEALRDVVLETVRSSEELAAEIDWLLPASSPWRSR